MPRRGRRHNSQGRSVGGDKFARLFKRTMQTPAWRALTPYAQRLYPWLQLEWNGSSENNNGSIRFSVRQAADALDCNSETARKAFADLQRKGFIVVTRCAMLGTDGEARGHEYELTEFGRTHEPRPGRRYLEWQSGKEFDVAKAATHNPTGKGGLKSKTRTCRISPAQLTRPEGPDLHGKTNGAEKGRFPTYGVSHPYLPGGVGGADIPDLITLTAGLGLCTLLPSQRRTV